MSADQRDALISERILASMRDGVVAIDLSGRIITFNEAAGRILHKDPATVHDRSFAEEFLTDESLDDFNEVVFKAVYEAETTHSVDVALHFPEGEVDLLVSSSFLTATDGERVGVVVVFSDTTQERKRRKLKRLFGEYVDPRIVERILSRDAGASRRADMTVSFADMRDYTGWSERLPADQLVDLLNRFLSAMTEAIGGAGGITDKYIGDAVMAVWGPPFTDGEHQARDACSAALAQMAALPALRTALSADGIPGSERLDAVMGVATGDVLSGDIGPPSTRNFTVIGNAVNLAARLQEAAKTYGQAIVVSEETRLRAGEEFAFRELDLVTVRGSERPAAIYALVGHTEALSAEAAQLHDIYGAGLAAMRERRWERARDAFAKCLALFPGDVPATVMLERTRAFEAHPPADNWDGVWRVAPQRTVPQPE